MAYTLIGKVGKRVVVLVSLTSTVIMAEENQQQKANVDEVMMQHVVVPPPSGPYASRLGMPGHARRAGHHMTGFFNHGMPPSSARPPVLAAPPEATPATPVYPPQTTHAGALSRGNTNAGAYRPEEPDRAASPPVPAYGYPGRGYAPGYRQGSPRGYGYPPAPPPGYGYYPAPPGYATPWRAPQSQPGASATVPATGQAE